MTSNSEDESGLGQESELGDPSGPSTSAGAVPSPVVDARSPSTCNEKVAPAKLPKTSARRAKFPNEKKKSVKPAVKYLCPQCNHETTNIVKHFAHKRQHRELTSCNFKCHLCNYESKIKGGLQRHVKRVHTKERPFTCPVCDFRAVDKPSMAKHIISKHKQDIGVDLSLYIDCIRTNNLHEEDLARPCPTDSNAGNAVNLNGSMAMEIKDAPEMNGNVSPKSVSAEVKQEKGKVTFREAENLGTLANDTEAQPSKETAKDVETPLVPKEKLADGVRKDGVGRKSRKKTVPSYRNLYSTPEYREMRARKLTCEFCLKQCSSQRSLLSHFNEHKSENVFCPICHMFIVDSDCRQAHIQNHLNTTHRYTCATCLSTFAESSEVVAHQQRDHRKSINVIMECMFCSFSSRSQERFSRHMTRCHMFGSDGPKHNAFDVSKMKTLLMDYERNKIKTNIKTELTDEPEEKHAPSLDEEAKDELQPSATERNFCDAPLDDQISVGDLEGELESSFFDISAHMNDSLDNFQELLNESEHLENIESSNENSHRGDKNCEERTVNKKKGDESCETAYLSDNSGGRHEDGNKVSIDSLRLTSTLGKKLIKSSVESSGLGLHGKMMDIPINEFNVPFELLQESGALRHPSPQHLENSFHLSRISTIANSLCDKTSSISANNVQKLRQRKALSKNHATTRSRIPSPDSTSGTK